MMVWFDFVSEGITGVKAVIAWRISADTNPRFAIPCFMRNVVVFHCLDYYTKLINGELAHSMNLWCYEKDNYSLAKNYDVLSPHLEPIGSGLVELSNGKSRRKT